MSTVSRDIAFLVLALWDPFLPQVSSGDPVYFSFSRESLNISLSRAGISYDDSVALICDAARELIEISDTDVEVRPEAFKKNECGQSPVILLIAQQVLAVEEMVDDPDGFSDNAYFPRLRRMISPRLPELSINPFEFDEFERIWRLFASEIRANAGSTEASITFRFGAHWGANKAKAFPLSQALLTREDLYTLVRRIEHRVVRSTLPDELWRLVRHEASHLSRRAQKLLAFSFLGPRVVEQLRAFASAVPIERFAIDPESRANSDTLRLGVFKESVDWLTEEFRPFLYDETRQERLEDSRSIWSYIEKLNRSNPIIYLPLSEFGDYWMQSRSIVRLESGDTLVALIKTGSPYVVDVRCPLLVNQVEHFLRAPVVGCPEYEIVELRLKGSAGKDLVVSRDRVSLRQSASGAEFEWLGGLRLDRRSQVYLRESLPLGVRFVDAEFTMDELVAVNGRPFSRIAFSEMLTAEHADVSYDIEFPGSRVARLTVGIRRFELLDRVGFPITEEGKIIPFVEHVPVGAPVLTGFDETAVRLSGSAALPVCIAVLHDLLSREQQEIGEQDIPRIEKCLKSLAVPEGTKRLLTIIKERIVFAETKSI